MAHAVLEEQPPVHMGLPVSNGKLAIWLFLVTEIMFFTGLIGTYIVLRNGSPTHDNPWPKPHDVHLVEEFGAVNTFVLICSSLTVVLAHWAIGRGNVRRATMFLLVTLGLGLLFLGIKAVEYKSKWDHNILPGHVFDNVEGPRGDEYMREVRKELEEIVPQEAGDQLDEAQQAFNAEHHYPAERPLAPSEMAGKLGITPEELDHRPAWLLYELKSSDTQNRRSLSAKDVGARVKGLLEEDPHLHLTTIIPFGNMWASCYFAMTGFHALHVFGGIVIFVILLLMALAGRMQARQEGIIELTGLYWHFVDIVWIFLFPLLYLI